MSHMIEDYTNGHQILSDGRTIWVNGPDRASVARLSNFHGVAMVDVHNPPSVQRRTGTECLDCRKDLRGAEAWDYFTNSVRMHFNVVIARKHKPTWAVEEKKDMKRKNLSESLEMFASLHGLQDTVHVHDRNGVQVAKKVPSSMALELWREERARLLGIENHKGPCPTKPINDDFWQPRVSEL